MKEGVYASDPVRLRAAAEKISAAANELEAEIGLLRDNASRLSAAEGETSARAGRCLALADELGELLRELREYREDLKTVCVSEEKTEAKLADAVAGVNF